MGQIKDLAAGQAMTQGLDHLEEQIEEALLHLTPRQRKFALTYGQGGITQQSAAVTAGYSENGIDRNAHRVYKATAKAVSLIRKRNELANGESLDSHRSKLIELFSLCATPGSPTWEPRTAHSIRRTLLEIDGHIKSSGQTGVNISIELVDPVAGITIESDTCDDISDAVLVEDNRSVGADSSKKPSQSDAD